MKGSGGIWTFGGIGFRLFLPGSVSEHARVEIRLDNWLFWARHAVDCAAQSVAAATCLRRRSFDSASEMLARLKAREIQGSLGAVCASAFCVEALYSAIRARSPIPQDLVDAWRKKQEGKNRKTRQSARIFETLKRKFHLGSETDRVRHSIETLFRARNRAVHPKTDWEAPVLDPELGVQTASAVVRFSAPSAYAATRETLWLLLHLLGRVRERETGELKKWSATARRSVEPIVAAWNKRVADFDWRRDASEEKEQR